MREAKIDQPLKTKQELISVCFQAIVSRRDQSGEASDSEMEEEGQAGSDAAQKTASDAARKTADAGQQGSQANPGVSGSGAAAVIPPAQAKRQHMIDQIMGSNVSVAAKSQQITAIMDLLSSVPAPAQPSLAAMHHAGGCYTPQRGGHAQARMPRPKNGPYNRGNAQYPPP